MDVSTALKAALEDAVRTGPDRATARSSALKAALAEHRDLILKAIAQGYSPTGLAKKLKASGITASVESLRQSLQAIAAAAPSGTKSSSTKRPPAKTAMRQASAPPRPQTTKNKAFEAEERTA